MSTHNIGFYEKLTKIIFQLSSNTHLISSSASLLPCVIDRMIDVKSCSRAYVIKKILF